MRLTRSQTMARVRSQDTKPELLVRKMLIRLGYCYRLHRADISGKPDIAFIGRRKLIFIHGCFWHGHDCKRGAREPKTNTEYWRKKIGGNRARDERNQQALREQGWRSLVLWECEIGEGADLERRLTDFLDDL